MQRTPLDTWQPNRLVKYVGPVVYDWWKSCHRPLGRGIEDVTYLDQYTRRVAAQIRSLWSVSSVSRRVNEFLMSITRN